MNQCSNAQCLSFDNCSAAALRRRERLDAAARARRLDAGVERATTDAGADGAARRDAAELPRPSAAAAARCVVHDGLEQLPAPARQARAAHRRHRVHARLPGDQLLHRRRSRLRHGQRHTWSPIPRRGRARSTRRTSTPHGGSRLVPARPGRRAPWTSASRTSSPRRATGYGPPGDGVRRVPRPHPGDGLRRARQVPGDRHHRRGGARRLRHGRRRRRDSPGPTPRSTSCETPTPARSR